MYRRNVGCVSLLLVLCAVLYRDITEVEDLAVLELFKFLVNALCKGYVDSVRLNVLIKVILILVAEIVGVTFKGNRLSESEVLYCKGTACNPR